MRPARRWVLVICGDPGPGAARGGDHGRVGSARGGGAMFEPAEEAMPPEERAHVQQRRLRTLIDRLLACRGVQAERLAAAGVRGGAEVSLGDLPRLPFSEKRDLWDAYPFG